MKGIVVLGCMLKECKPTDEMKGRVERAVQFARLIIPDIMIFSGGRTSAQCAHSEAGMMQKLALSLGADEKLLKVEEKSTTTVENAVYVRELLEIEGFTGDLYIVTSCYHMIRSISIFRTVIPSLTTLSGLCFECKPERLQSEADRLIIDQNLMSKVPWDSQDWLKDFEDIKNNSSLV